MSALAHVFEAHGLATVALASVWGQVERSRPPRALYCEFPLGRPLGKPGDAAFQRRVLDAAFDLLRRPEGPVLERFDEVVGDAEEQPLACPMPPRLDEGSHPAVDELRGLRSAHERAVTAHGGRTSMEHLQPDELVGVVEALAAIVGGTPWKEAGIPLHPHDAVADLRAYYEEAATQLVDHTPAARQAEAWFYDHTESGRLTLAARTAMKEQGAGFATWFYMAPATRP